MYAFVMSGVIGEHISVIGIVCNIGSVIVFRHGVIKTSTTYQLHWLALVDTIFLVMCFICQNLYHIMLHYLNNDNDNLYWRVILPYTEVSISPVWHIAQTSTNWLTVFIGVYRYLAICKPASNSYHHVERHSRMYVKIVISIAVLCNIPYFFVYKLSQDDRSTAALKKFGNHVLFKLVYDILMDPVFIVYLPLIILLIVTIKMMVVLRKKQSNMQHSNTSNLDINTVLITILLTFLLCQVPLLIDRILHFMYGLGVIETLKCGSFPFYNSGFMIVFLALNSAARPFIYMVLKNRFTWPLRHSLRNEISETIEMGSM